MSYVELDNLSNPYRASVSAFENAPPPGNSSATQGINLAVENPWLTIWTKPRATIRGIVDYNPSHRIFAIAMFGSALMLCSALEEVRKSENLVEIIVGVLGGTVMLGLMFLLYLWAVGWWLGVVGRWLGGHAHAREVRAAVAWGFVPSLEAAVPLVLVFIGVSLTTGFSGSNAQPGPAAMTAFGLTVGLFMIAVFWGAFVNFKVLGEVHGFSAWRGLATIFLGNILINGLMLVGILFFVFAILLGSGRFPAPH